MSAFPVPVSLTVTESTMSANMTVAESAIPVTMDVMTGTAIIPRNYGLITWDGHVMTVS